MKAILRRRVLLVAITACAAVGVAGVAYAVIPDSAGVVHGCYNKKTGGLRVIDDSSQNCTSAEASLEFYSKAGSDAAFLGKSAQASDSDLLDGKDSTEFLGAGAKAADADKLDGLDSAAFAKGNVDVVSRALRFAGPDRRELPVGPMLVGLFCDDPQFGNAVGGTGQLSVVAQNGSTTIGSGGRGPQVISVAHLDRVQLDAWGTTSGEELDLSASVGVRVLIAENGQCTFVVDGIGTRIAP